MRASCDAGASWPWAVAAILTCAAIVLSYALGGSFSAPQVDWLPERVQPQSLEQWKPEPAKAVQGWLPRSRWDPTPFFDVRKTLARRDEILDMGPGPEDIPALDHPRMVPATQGGFLKPDDEVLGVGLTQPRCYPLSILRWHSVVNDSVDGSEASVVFDPLSGASVVISHHIGSELLSFGVSGKAYNGAGLLYDRETHSLWHPITGQCIAGRWLGQASLTVRGATRTTFDAWRRLHPTTLVLSPSTGFGRPYALDPYAAAPLGPNGQPVNYWADPNLVLAPPLRPVTDRRLPAKVLVLGVRSGEASVAFAAPTNATVPVTAQASLAGQMLTATWDPRPESRGFSLAVASGPPPTSLTCFWYAWQAAHPRTGLVLIPLTPGPT